jgi:hypothetical protein
MSSKSRLCRLPSLKSVAQQVDGSDHEAVLFNSACIEFGIHEAFNLREKHTEGIRFSALDAVKIDEVAQRKGKNSARDSVSATIALKQHALRSRLSAMTVSDTISPFSDR